MSQSNTIETLIFSNPFDLYDFEHLSVEAEDRTIKDLLYGVNTDLDFSVQLNGREIEEHEYGTVVPKAGEVLSILVLPGGGDNDGKTIVRIIATIILTVVTQGAYAAYGAWAAAAVAAGGTLLINAILPFETPNMDASEGMSGGESPTYGIDGPKNTSREGIPVPITFGKSRVAGNIVSLYTDNRGREQYLYMLINAGEGPIKDITNIKFNDIDAESFNPTITKRLGTADQAEIPGFETVKEVKNIGFSFKNEHDLFTFETNNEPNKIDLSVTIPRLYDLVKNEMQSASIKLAIKMRPLGSNEPWQYLQTGSKEGDLEFISNASGIPISESDGEFYPNTKEFTEGGVTYESVVDVRDYKDFTIREHGRDVAENSLIREGEGRYRGSREPRDSKPQYKKPRKIIKGVNIHTGEEEEVGRISGSATPYGIRSNYNENGIHKIRRKVMSPYRYNISSRPVKPQKYEVMIDRISAQRNDENGNPLPSDWQLNDIIESMPYGVSYKHTALLGVEVLVTDQLSRIPNVTFDLEGAVLDVYDSETGEWKKENTANPAWITYNVLTHKRWGGRYDRSQVDLPAFIKWAKVCDENGWMFNGTFDTDGNIFDSLKSVYKVGHARRTMHGDLFSVSIIHPKMPSMLFNESNIKSGSLSISWSGSEDRANEIDVIFYDRENDYKRSEFKVYDQLAFQRGDEPRATQLTLHGVVDYQQAFDEGMFALNMNRIGQTVSFTSTLEGKDVQIGDVVYIQHPMPNWSVGGRVSEHLDSNGNSILELDKEVTLSESEYELIVQFPSLSLGEVEVVSFTDNKFTLGDFADQNISQIVFDGEEYIVLGYLNDSVVQVDRNITGTGNACIAYAKDVVQSRTVTTGPGTHNEITLDGLLPSNAKGLAWSLGEVQYRKKQFLITGVKSSDVYEYEITGMEYVPELMTSGETGPLPNYTPPIDEKIKPVTDINFEVNMRGQGSLRRLILTAYWSYPESNLFQQADVWVSKNDEDPKLYQSRAGTYSDIEVEHLDRVKVIVCARNGVSVQELEQSSFGTILIEHNTAPEKPDEFSVALFQDTAVLSWADAKNDIGEDIVGHYKVLRRSQGFARDSEGRPLTPAPTFYFNEDGTIPDGFDLIAKTTQTYYVDEPIQTNTYYDYVVIPADISGAENEVEPVHELLTTPAEFDLRSKEGIEVMYFTGPADYTLSMVGTPETKPELWSKKTTDAHKFQATRYYRLGVATPWIITVLFDSIDSISDEVIQQVNDSIKNVDERVEAVEGELQTLEEQYDDRLNDISDSAFKSEAELEKILQQNLVDIVGGGESKRSDAQHSYQIERISSEIVKNDKAVQAEIVRIDETIATEKQASASARESIVSQIEDESATRKSAITNLQESIASESQARATDISKVNTAISDESTTRASEIKSVNESISSEASTRATQFNSLDAAISNETTERKAAITSVNQAISNETSARVSQYNSLDTAITGEISDRKSAINEVNDAISNESTARAQALTQLESSLNSEISSSIKTNNRTMVGYCMKSGSVTSHETPSACEAAGGVWRAASPFAESLKAAELTDGSGNTIQALSYFRALEDDTGELMARSFVGVNSNGVLTGVHVNGSNSQSKIRLAAEELEVYSASRNMSPITWDGSEMVIRGHLKSSTFESGTINGGTINGTSFTGGYYRTASPSYNGNRTVVGGGGNYAIWSGKGSQTDSSAVFYVKKNGGAVFKGDLVGNNITGATLNGVDGNFTGTVRAEKIIGEQSAGGFVELEFASFYDGIGGERKRVLRLSIKEAPSDRIVIVDGIIVDGSDNAPNLENSFLLEWFRDGNYESHRYNQVNRGEEVLTKKVALTVPKNTSPVFDCYMEASLDGSWPDSKVQFSRQILSFQILKESEYVTAIGHKRD